MEPSKTHGATLPQQDLTRPVEGCLSGLRPADLLQGGHEGANPHVGSRVAVDEAVDNATAGTLHSPRVFASTQGDVISRLDVYKMLIAKSKEMGSKIRPTDLPLEDRSELILTILGFNKTELNDEKAFKEAIARFTYKCEMLYKNCKYNFNFFAKKNNKWLKESLKNDLNKFFFRALQDASLSESVMITDSESESNILSQSPDRHELVPQHQPLISDFNTDRALQAASLSESVMITDSESESNILSQSPDRHELVPHHQPLISDFNTDRALQDASLSESVMITDSESESNILSQSPDRHELVQHHQPLISDFNTDPNFSVQDLPVVIEENIFNIAISPTIDTIASTSSCLVYESLSDRQKRRVCKELQYSLESEPPTKVIKAVSSALEAKGQKLKANASKDLQYVINTCLESPTRPTKIATKLREDPRPYSPDEALAVFIDRKFTVETYNFLQQDLKSRGFPAFPPYSKVFDAKQKCYPDSAIQVTEREAFVPLVSLLSHTLQRLINSCDDIISEYCEQKGLDTVDCIFEGSWGFDGSSGQSFYKQNFSDNQEPENTLFATTFIPLRIKTKKDFVLWLNPTPQSYRFCRPIHIQYRKETKDLILNEQKLIENQIRDLTTLEATTSNEKKIRAKPQLYLTCIDGKVLNIITETSSQLKCPFCKATSTQFNKLDIIYSQPIDVSVFKYGISPLHAWIRVLEFLLHLGYKLPVKKWRVGKDSMESKTVEETKKRVQERVRKDLKVLVDVVRPNAGTTNDGNTARTVLSDKNRAVFAEILGLGQWLLDDLHTILITLSCGLPVNANKFGDFCKSVASKYVAEYGWYPMTVTIHKILIHGQDIINNSALPLGLLSEQAGEARNKFWRYDREHHSRKSDREKTMLDLFHRALESSDPQISYIRLQNRLKKLKSLPLPPSVVRLLKPYEISAEDDFMATENDENFEIIEGHTDNVTEILSSDQAEECTPENN